eukprot:s422_g38.t4
MPPNKDDGKSARFPLLFAAQELEKLDPERIPCDSDQTNWGGYKPNHALQQMGKTMYTWARGEEKAQNDLLRLIGGVALNAGDRVDWSLQEDISMWTTVGVAGELMQALPSHSCYMKSPDVAAFIQNHSTKIAVANSLVAKHGPEMFPDASETGWFVPRKWRRMLYHYTEARDVEEEPSACGRRQQISQRIKQVLQQMV